MLPLSTVIYICVVVVIVVVKLAVCTWYLCWRRKRRSRLNLKGNEATTSVPTPFRQQPDARSTVGLLGYETVESNAELRMEGIAINTRGQGPSTHGLPTTSNASRVGFLIDRNSLVQPVPETRLHNDMHYDGERSINAEWVTDVESQLMELRRLTTDANGTSQSNNQETPAIPTLARAGPPATIDHGGRNESNDGNPFAEPVTMHPHSSQATQIASVMQQMEEMWAAIGRLRLAHLDRTPIRSVPPDARSDRSSTLPDYFSIDGQVESEERSAARG